MSPRSSCAGSIPSSCASSSSASAAAASQLRISWSSRRIRPRSARPSMSRTCSAVTAPAPWAIAWSMIGELLSGDTAKVEPLAAREHCYRHLVHLGRCEEELHMLRWLLKCFQQGIESWLGKHVNFVDDVDFVARADRGVAHRVDDLSDIIHPRMRSGVHLDDVDVPSLGNGAAWLAYIAGRDRRTALPVRADAVQGLCDQPRRRGFADPPDSGEKESMRDPAALDRVGESLHHRVLTDQLGKGLRAVLAREYAVRGRSCRK